MTKKHDLSVFDRYHLNGHLDKKYYINNSYYQPYNAKERYHAGILFYKDFLSWKRGHLKATDLTAPKVDGTRRVIGDNISSERFRRALKNISSPFVPILYKIILEQSEIRPPKKLSNRERLYFNDEIKTLLCRGLDELISYYKR